jgi:predicted ATP-grasp superfamily ATP-dependent carboligase
MKVLVTGAAWKIGIAVISSLSKEGFTIIGTDERALPFRIHSRHLISYYTHAPYSDDKFYEDIISIIKKEIPDVLIPIGGTRQISLHKKEISKYINILVPDYESFCTVYNKTRTYKLCKDVEVAMPQRFTETEAEYLLKNERNTNLVIKPDYDIGAACGLSFVKTIKELEEVKKNIQGSFGNYVIEEFIPGASKMRAVQLIFNKEHKISAYFILKKIHQWPITGGITAYAESTDEWELLEFVKPFFEKCLWEGPVEVELIIDERDGKPKLIEINPRFAGSIAFAIHCGINFPYIVSMASMNRYFESSSNYDSGMFYINLSYYSKAVFTEYKRTKNKSKFLYQVIKELRQKKVGVSPDIGDFPVYFAKALKELKNSLF